MTYDTSTGRSMETDSSLFGAYIVPAGSYDEVFAAPGVLRPHWQTVVRSLNALGPHKLAHRWEQARRMMHENGVTYNVDGDPQGMDRPWELDAIPLLIPPDEWSRLEVALAQRARLLDAILADVYGPQKLVGEGMLPPELVFAHTGFLRPCHGIPIPNECYLHLYAADLGRTPDGQWWVLADRTQSPAGAGYALENRLILSRVLPVTFRDSQAQRLAPFFATLHQALLDMAPRHRDNPRVVLLTPGPYHETYFEHAYLARYLGYTLVEGADLTVRDQGVFLKTLEGLQPVDVILRRLDDAWCDPLELSPGSLLGTAGLVQAVRAGNVAVANTLGSGWLESAALMALFPALCRHLLGEELALPSVPTWWCGDPADLSYVLDHLEQVVVVPGLPTNFHQVRFGDRLSHAAQQQFAAHVRARPYAYAAQQRLMLSSAPVWNGAVMQPQHMVLRVYVAATEHGYTVMPGGLTRVSAANGSPAIAMPGDSGSKDTWVLSAAPVSGLSFLPSVARPIQLRRSGYDFPSRAADNLLWMGRYVERAEGLVRLLRSILVRLTDDSGPAGSAALPALYRALHMAWDIPSEAPTYAESTLAAQEVTLLAALFDMHETSKSVRANLSALHRISAMVRDYMTLETWRIVTHLDEDFVPPQEGSLSELSDILELVGHTITTLAAFSGLMEENMIRGPEWHFLDMGRRLERTSHTTSLLRSMLVDVDENESAALAAVLEIGDSAITYRSRYLTTLQCMPVLDLLLSDDTNPRAVLYQIVKLAEHVDNLPRDRSLPALSSEQRLATTMLTQVRLAEVETLCQIRRNGRRSGLDRLLGQLLADLSALSDTITHHYLSHAEPARHLAQVEAKQTP